MSEHAYPRTPVGEVDVKVLPPSIAFEAEEPGGDFEESRRDLFRANFRFLKENDLKMTAPVERDVDVPRMRFFVPQDAEDHSFTPTPGVRVVRMPARTVVSLGLRGGYSERRFAEGENELLSWLATHPEWTAVGEAYGAYWNGPLVPAPIRRMEVHIPIEATPA